MRKLKKLCMILAVFVLALIAAPIGKAEAKEGVLKEYFPSSTVYLPYSSGMYARIIFPKEQGDKVTYTNKTTKYMSIMQCGVEYGTNNFVELKRKKNTTGKIQINLERGGQVYTKTLSVKWYTYPVPKKLTIGGKSYLSKIKNCVYYNNLDGYLTGKVSVTAPSGWKLESKIIALVETKNGVSVKFIKNNAKLPSKCVTVQFTLTNKKNSKISQSITLSTAPVEQTCVAW